MDIIEFIAIAIIGILCIYNATNIGYNMGKSSCNDIIFNSSYTQLNTSDNYVFTNCTVNTIYTDDLVLHMTCYGGE